MSDLAFMVGFTYKRPILAPGNPGEKPFFTGILAAQSERKYQRDDQ